MKTLRSYSQQLLNIPDSTVNYSYHVVHDISSTSVQFSFSVMCDSLRPHGLQHARLPCPSPSPRACSNSRPLSQWCHATVLFSVILFSSCLQSYTCYKPLLNPEEGKTALGQTQKILSKILNPVASSMAMMHLLLFAYHPIWLQTLTSLVIMENCQRNSK